MAKSRIILSFVHYFCYFQRQDLYLKFGFCPHFISKHWSHHILSENRRPSDVFWYFQEVRKDTSGMKWVNENWWRNFVGNKAKGGISKRVFQENKARQIFQKANISYPPDAHVRFSENLACFVFSKHPFWDSPFCLISDDLWQMIEKRWKIITLHIDDKTNDLQKVKV